MVMYKIDRRGGGSKNRSLGNNGYVMTVTKPSAAAGADGPNAAARQA